MEFKLWTPDNKNYYITQKFCVLLIMLYVEVKKRGNGNFFMEIRELKSFDGNGIPEFNIYDSITSLPGWHSYPYVFPMELL